MINSWRKWCPFCGKKRVVFDKIKGEYECQKCLKTGITKKKLEELN